VGLARRLLAGAFLGGGRLRAAHATLPDPPPRRTAPRPLPRSPAQLALLPLLRDGALYSGLLLLLALLMGAPATADTAAWAAAQAAVSVLPLVSAAAAAGTSLPLLVLHRQRRAGAWSALLPAAASLAGAWLGACAGPLDWDTAWQRWPVASAMAGVGGLLVGELLALAVVGCGGGRGRAQGGGKEG
jgi:hypothetical protein